MSDTVRFEDLLKPRIPPNVWDIIGYGGGLIAIFYYNKLGIIIYSCFFVLYGLLNIIFDYFTVAFEYTDDNFPTYDKLGNHKWFIPNKKYKLDHKFANDRKNSNLGYSIIDNSKILVEFSIYNDKSQWIKNMLFIIYFMGVTKKNYTLIDISNFNNNILYFV